jgi:hypothetical protein
MKKYLATFVIVFVVGLIGSSIYQEITKEPKSAKAKRIPCQKKATAFERCYDVKLLQEAIKQIKNGNFKLTSSIEKAKYTQSKLFNYVKLEDTDKIALQKLNSFVKQKQPNKQQMVTLHYYIYENDINDPGKKTKKSKLYAGYIVFQVKNNNHKLLYQVQIDFMDRHGKDISQSMKCCIESLMTYLNSINN